MTDSDHPEVTAHTLAAHARYLRERGHDRSAALLEEEGEKFVRESPGVVNLSTFLARAYMHGVYEHHPERFTPWNCLPDREQEAVRAGIRSVLTALAKLDLNQKKIRDMVVRDTAVEELTEAIRLTVEYVGVQTLMPIEGWSWYNVMVKYAPVTAEQFRREYMDNPYGLSAGDQVVASEGRSFGTGTIKKINGTAAEVAFPGMDGIDRKPFDLWMNLAGLRPTSWPIVRRSE